MVKRLELEALKADLAAVEVLLSERSQAEDPSGWLQYAQRKAELVLFARTDASGRFHFDRLAPGEYLIASEVRWSPTGPATPARCSSSPPAIPTA